MFLQRLPSGIKIAGKKSNASPEGRVVKNCSAFEYQYAIADHQGNTRALFTSATPTPVASVATMEPNPISGLENSGTNCVNAGLYDHTDAGIDGTDVKASNTDRVELMGRKDLYCPKCVKG